MTPETRQYPVVEAVIDRFARWLKHRREIAESCNCNSEEYSRIAHDLNLSTAELNTLVRRGAHATDELPKMMQALRIDPEAIRRVEPTRLASPWPRERGSNRRLRILVGVVRLIANHLHLAIFESTPEVRALPSAGITRPHRSYA